MGVWEEREDAVWGGKYFIVIRTNVSWVGVLVLGEDGNVS